MFDYAYYHYSQKLLIILNFTAIFFNFSLFQLKTATIFCSNLLSEPVTAY